MPAAIPVIAAVAVKAAAVGLGLSALTASIIGAVVSIGLGQLFSPKKPSGGGGSFKQKGQSLTQTVRGSVESRKVVYGISRLGGVLADAQVVDGSGTNDDLHMVVLLTTHEVAAIDAIFMSDEVITKFDDDGTVREGKYEGKVRVIKHLGSDDQEASQELIDTLGYTETDRLRGIAYLHVILSYDKDVFPNGIPQVSALVRGKPVYDLRDDIVRYSNNWALCVLDFLKSRYGLEVSDDELDLPSFIAAANLCDSPVAICGGTVNFGSRSIVAEARANYITEYYEDTPSQKSGDYGQGGSAERGASSGSDHGRGTSGGSGGSSGGHPGGDGGGGAYGGGGGTWT